MPFTYHIDGDQQLVRIVATGLTDLRVVEARMRELHAELQRLPNLPILADYRELESEPSANEARHLSHLHADPDVLRSHPMAVVVAPGLPFGLARMIAMVANLNGAQVEAFLSLHEALAWLRALPVPPRS